MSRSDCIIRQATRADLRHVVALLADDALGRTREDGRWPLAQPYLDAFDAIEADPNQLLAAVESRGAIVGTLQLSFIPNISRLGTRRCQIEGVRIAAQMRDSGLGRQMIEWAVAQARARGCGIVQLTCDASRHDAQRFYRSLGFEGTHIGFKRAL